MKIIIWGLGNNGKNLIDMLGVGNVVAIIESNLKKIREKKYNNIPIISFQTYLNKYQKYYIVVTPMKYYEIESLLKRHHINRYFIQNLSKVRIHVFADLKENIFIEMYKLKRDVNYYISGINLFSIYLYEYLIKRGYSVDFYLNNSSTSFLLDNLTNDGIIEQGHQKNKIMEGVLIQTDEYSDVPSNFKIIDYHILNNKKYEDKKIDLKRFKNCHKGKRVFIVATGPSLRMEDLNQLYKNLEYSISMNLIFHAFKNTNWRPHYYVISDGEMIREYERDKIAQRNFFNTEKFVSDSYLKFWEKKWDSSYHFFRLLQEVNDIHFSNDFSNGAFSGLTVTYICMQLAVYMGFKDIYLLGCDTNFSKDFKSKEDHFYKEVSKHYTFDYEFVGKAYNEARYYTEKNNINIYNATRGGKLEIFPRVNFESLFE